jgi:transposase
MRATFEAAILGILEADASLADRFAMLTSILAPSNITAFALLIEMPSPDSQGVGPVARSFEAAEPTSARRSTCQPSSPHPSTPDMKAKYAHLIKTEKPAEVALTTIMRKLVVLANALLKANRPWTPKTG